VAVVMNRVVPYLHQSIRITDNRIRLAGLQVEP